MITATAAVADLSPDEVRDEKPQPLSGGLSGGAISRLGELTRPGGQLVVSVDLNLPADAHKGETYTAWIIMFDPSTCAGAEGSDAWPRCGPADFKSKDGKKTGVPKKGVQLGVYNLGGYSPGDPDPPNACAHLLDEDGTPPDAPSCINLNAKTFDGVHRNVRNSDDFPKNSFGKNDHRWFGDPYGSEVHIFVARHPKGAGRAPSEVAGTFNPLIAYSRNDPRTGWRQVFLAKEPPVPPPE